MALSSKEKAHEALNLLAFGLFANLYNILTLLYSQSKMYKWGRSLKLHAKTYCPAYKIGIASKCAV
jgi:hypothetical protein